MKSSSPLINIFLQLTLIPASRIKKLNIEKIRMIGWTQLDRDLEKEVLPIESRKPDIYYYYLIAFVLFANICFQEFPILINIIISLFCINFFLHSVTKL